MPKVTPVLVDQEPWTLVVVVALTAVFGWVAIRAAGIRERRDGSAHAERFQRVLQRVGRPVAAVLAGVLADAFVAVLLSDLHNPGGAFGVEYTPPGLASFS